MAAEDDVRKKERDPILLVCFVTLVLAFGVVGGIFVNDNFFSGNSGPAATAGHTVEVDYNGSFYNYYDNDGVIFDTSFWDIANDENRAKSFEFTLRKESEYKPLSFTVGSPSSYLQMFTDAVTGLQKGDVARVVIDPENGYGVLTEKMMERVSGFTIPVMQTISYADFKANYNGGENLEGNTTMDSPFGWKMNVFFTSADADVIIEHRPTVNTTYDMNDDVKVKVTDMTGGTVTYELVIDYQTYTQNFEGDLKDAKFEDRYDYVKTVKVFNDGREFFLYAVEFDTDGKAIDWVFKYIETDASGTKISETAGMFLCFVITVKSVS